MNPPAVPPVSTSEPSKKRRKSAAAAGSDNKSKKTKTKTANDDGDAPATTGLGTATPSTSTKIVVAMPVTPATATSPKAGYCHHCHRGTGVIVCTLMKTIGKKTKRCRIAFCDKCLRRNYDNSIEEIHGAGKPHNLTTLGHDASEAYLFRCPVCEKKCQCYLHRPPEEAASDSNTAAKSAAHLAMFAKEAGVDPAEIEGMMNDTPTRNRGKGKEVVKGKEKVVVRPESAKKKTDKGKEKAIPKSESAKKPKAEAEAKAKAEAKGLKKAPLKKDKAKEEAQSSSTLKLVTISGPMPPAVKKPKHVEDPNFEFLAISHPLPVIALRLQIREFYLRFEKHSKVLVKYARLINDPNSDWTDLTYKNLINMMVNVLRYDEKTPAEKKMGIDPTILHESARALTTLPADSPEIWAITRALIEVWHDGRPLRRDSPAPSAQPEEDVDSEDDEFRLRLICKMINLVLNTHTYHEWVDAGASVEKKHRQACVDEVKKLKTEWEEQRQVLQKERLTLPAAHKADFEVRYNAAQNASKTLIRSAEMKEWAANRKTASRITPLGIDTLGNLYHLFTQRDPMEEDWGSWVVVEKGKNLPHPTGVLPPPPSIASDPGADHEEDHDEDQEEPEEYDEEAIRERVWYAVSEPCDIRQLADWIKYKGDSAIYEQATQNHPPTPGPSVPVSPKNATPARQFLSSVNVSPTKGGAPANAPAVPAAPVKKEDFMPLVDKIRKIADYFELMMNPAV
ncbi:hypothetical protein BZA05DRAFT_415498 [Tricharina praecox]|uniref:uncharacterized protein n=1 Tax=Tricharina praecox TaxID=43433 RepID=UPI00221F9947|nr:uncharacterized protein BZA05DRAFT_415498 [Tricharina praecox]KAI5858138.1 hypothetical protein BZA05DRAFT_415498 [Tricharina praecox]